MNAARTLKAFAGVMSLVIKAIDHNHLVGLGTMGGGQCGAQGDDCQSLSSLPELDLCEYHDYQADAAMPGDQFKGLQRRLDQCRALNKPLMVDEVGIRPSDVGGTLEARAAMSRPSSPRSSQPEWWESSRGRGTRTTRHWTTSTSGRAIRVSRCSRPIDRPRGHARRA